MPDGPLPDESFWAGLLTEPEALNAQQCMWIQRTRLGVMLREMQQADRQRLGPLDDARRFTAAAAIF